MIISNNKNITRDYPGKIFKAKYFGEMLPKANMITGKTYTVKLLYTGGVYVKETNYHGFSCYFSFFQPVKQSCKS